MYTEVNEALPVRTTVSFESEGKKVNENTKIAIAIVIGAIVIGLSIYFSFQLLSETIAGKFFGS